MKTALEGGRSSVDRRGFRREETRRNKTFFFFTFGDAFAKLPALIG
jgi:hypothetical protein